MSRGTLTVEPVKYAKNWEAIQINLYHNDILDLVKDIISSGNEEELATALKVNIITTIRTVHRDL